MGGWVRVRVRYAEASPVARATALPGAGSSLHASDSNIIWFTKIICI